MYLLCERLFRMTGKNEKKSGAPMATKQIFREKSLDRMAFSRELHSYLKGSGRTAWITLIAIVLIVAAMIVWAELVTPEHLISTLFN